MSQADRDQMTDQAKGEAKALQQQADQLQKRLDEINKQLANKGLSEKDRKALEDEKKSLEQQLQKNKADQQKNQEMQKALQLSDEARKVFEKMMKDPLFKQLMEIEKNLASLSKKDAKPGDQPKLTDEQREEIRKALEELAKKLKDDKAMQEYLKKLLEAALKAKELGRCNGAGMGLGNLPLGMGSGQGNSSSSSSGGQAPPGPGAPSEDIWQGDNHHVYKLGEAADQSKGTTNTTSIRGQQRPSSQPQQYVEIKAPTTVGDRTSVPYQNILPSYKRKAESALNRQEIPKEHQKRVKEYFDSLTGGKKN